MRKNNIAELKIKGFFLINFSPSLIFARSPWTFVEIYETMIRCFWHYWSFWLELLLFFEGRKGLPTPHPSRVVHTQKRRRKSKTYSPVQKIILMYERAYSPASKGGGSFGGVLVLKLTPSNSLNIVRNKTRTLRLVWTTKHILASWTCTKLPPPATSTREWAAARSKTQGCARTRACASSRRTRRRTMETSMLPPTLRNACLPYLTTSLHLMLCFCKNSYLLSLLIEKKCW